MKGEIWIYHDKRDSKRKLGVIIGSDSATIVELNVATEKVTSSSVQSEFDVVVEYWEEAGLVNPAIVRCTKLRSINKRDLLYKVGTLCEKDLETVLQTIAKYIKS
jgi:mRNA interferase MazF